MNWICFAVLAASGVLLAYQDFKTRLLSLWLVIVFATATLLYYVSTASYRQLIENTIFCACYLLFSYLILFLYYYIKHRQPESIMNTKLGWGDALIFIAIGVCLEPITLVYFFTCAFIISLLLSLLFFRKQNSIPLAGFTILIYIGFLVINMLCYIRH